MDGPKSENNAKQAKYLSVICWKEFALKSGKTENQELPGNVSNIGKLFGWIGKLFGWCIKNGH